MISLPTPHRITFLAFAGILFFSGQAFSDAQPRMEGVVAFSNVLAMSGPGPGYYPTQVLAVGQKVTVFGTKRGAWAAILPPAGSFSWIAADAVTENADGTAKVLADDTKVRVGSRLTDAHHVFQTTLKKDAKVRLLDQVFLKEMGRIKKWYKILPPDNEVRYVLANQLQNAEGDPLFVDPETKDQKVETPKETKSSSTAVAGPVGLQNGLIPPAQPVAKTQQQVLANASHSESLIMAPRDRIGPPLHIADNPQLPWEDRLKYFRAQLELMRSRDPAMWNLTQFRKVLQSAQADAKDTPYADKVNHLIQQVDWLSDLQRRYVKFRQEINQARQLDKELAILQHRAQNDVRRARPQWTARGKLAPARTEIEGQPAFRLLDDQGTTRFLLLLSPGMSVEPFLHQQVAVIGKRENLDQWPVPLIRVQQISPIATDIRHLTDSVNTKTTR